MLRLLKAVLMLAFLTLLAGGAFLAWQMGLLDSAWTTPIGEIRANPADYPDGTQVRVKGEVASAVDIPFTKGDAYEVVDETGRIWVRTDAALPEKGRLVVVTGRLARVEQDLVVGKIEGVYLEQEHVRFRRFRGW